jgi:hypothetical protein
MTERQLLRKAEKIPHGTVKVEKRPKCDFCAEVAVVDGKTRFGPWAYMCLLHFRSYGVGLGLGKGQFLLVEEG